MTPEQLAQIAYEAWRNSTPIGVNFVGWTGLAEGSKHAWIAAAQAVKANVLGSFTKVGEGEAL